MSLTETVREAISSPDRFYIGGEWAKPSSTDQIEVINASTEDVRAVALPILQHRIILDYNARLDGTSTSAVVEKLLAEIPAHDLERPKTLLDAKLR